MNGFAACRGPHSRSLLTLVLAGFVVAGLVGTLVAGAPAAQAGPTLLGLSAPVVGAGRASATYDTAALGAVVNPGGLPTTYFVEYGPTVSYGSQTVSVSLAAGSAPVSVTGRITGLHARTAYHFRLVATNLLGTTMGPDGAFTTAVAPAKPKPKPKPVAKRVAKAPVARTGGAGAVTFASAALRGTVNPKGQPATYFFEYGPTARYGSQSATAALAAGSRAVAVTTSITGLGAMTKHHFRLVAVNATGAALGDATFTSRAIPLSLAIGGLPSPVAFGSTASIVGTLSGTGAAGRPVVLQQNPYPFTAGFQTLGNPELATAAGGFAFNLISLTQTTQFRVLTVGGGAPIVSSTLTEDVALAVTLHVTSRRTATGPYRLGFSGRIAPAETGARVSVQRLVLGRWEYVSATSARPSGADHSSYATTLRRRQGGLFRVHVAPVEGWHVASVSRALLVHAKPTG